MRRRSVLAAAAGLAVTAALVGPPAAAAPPGANPHKSLAADPESRAVAAADQAVSSGLDKLRKGPDETYWRRAVTGGASGMFYVAYERTFKGLPVVGGDAVVVTDSQGNVRDTTAASKETNSSLGIQPKVGADSATKTASGRFQRVDTAEAPRLVVLAWGAQPKLAWESVVTGVAEGKPSKQHVFVDARTGKVADSYDEVREGTGNGYYYPSSNISTSQSGSTYRMVDTSRPGIQCGGQNGSPYTGPDDVWGNNSGTDLETACVDALYSVQKEWDMLRDWLGRNGIDGAGRGFPAEVGLSDVNAYWDGSKTNFGHSQDNQRQATPIDVVGHEFGHAIFQTTPGGAGSGNENGGINEGTGDIYGALTEAYANNPNDPPDYTVGEEVNLVGDGPIRYMYNPSQVGDPNCYSSSIPSTEVHAAAGPLNHWFYLLAEGSSPGGGKPNSPICSGGPSSVTGISIQKAGKIYLGAMQRKTSSWRYANVRSASLAAAVELYGANSAECAATKAAWNAVSVPVQSGEPTCTSPTQDFSISTNPTSGSVNPGQSATTTVGTQTTAGNPQTVNLTASGLPSGATASFNPASVTSGNSSTLTISTSASTPAGTSTITVTGTGASGSHTATYQLTVGSTPPTRDFSIAVNPSSGTVQTGQAITTTVSTQTTQGTAQTVNLTASGLPTGGTASFNPASVTSGNNSTLTISTTSSTPAGSYQVTIRGAGETGAHTTVFALTVQGQNPGRTFRNDTDYFIDDYEYITSSVTSTASGTAQSPVKVTATSNHTCIEDLDIWLQGPNGRWYHLRSPGGTSCTVFGTRNWSVPVSQQAAGTWTLYIEDYYAQDTGTLDWWSITV
ncbi:M4 family metallopeptidase [Nonomuraea sp. NPDC050536]|uniref:M4 family metallopeptidase n=1 Tax=Nonomuraea sp. NPDC050536 TaxID=3364366 RepID=UPI0037C5F492